MALAAAILELPRGGADTKSAAIVEEIVKIERKLFPKHESLAKSFHEELRKNNTGLLYATVPIDGGEKIQEVAGYVMFTWPSSLLASITKLAGNSRPISVEK